MAQETVSTSGGNATGSGGSASYTVGQVAYTQQSSTSGSVSAGVQQGYEIAVVNNIGSALSNGIDCKAFPNPAVNQLILTVTTENISGLSYGLYDMNGKLIVSDKVNANSVSVNMEKISSATYFLKIIRNKIEIKTFKIVKL